MANTSITPEDFVQATSNLAVHSSAALIAGSFCYGVFCFISGLSLYILSRRSAKSPVGVIRITIILLLCIFSVSDSLQASGYIIRNRWVKMGVSGSAMYERWNATSALYSELLKPMMMLHPIPYIAADAVPIWRAYTLWSRSASMKASLITICILNTAICIARSILEYVTMTFNSMKGIANFLYPGQISFSILTNGFATVVIAIRAWRHRDSTREIRKSSPSVLYVLVVLVEAGCVLCLTQSLNLALYVSAIIGGYTITDAYSFAALVMSIFGDTVSAAYPALTVVALSFRGSMLERADDLVPWSLNLSETVREADVTLNSFHIAQSNIPETEESSVEPVPGSEVHTASVEHLGGMEKSRV